MSALREAIIGVLSGPAMDEFVLGNDGTDGLIDRLVAAVEGVPQTVTIRDLSMEDPGNVVTVDGYGLRCLYEVAEAAYIGGHPMHLTVDAGDLKVKVGGYTWSAPIRTEVYEG